MSSEKLKLEVWQGDWKLPSTDFKCLQALALLKISDVQCEVKKATSPLDFSGRRYPILKHIKEEQIFGVYEEFKNIWEFVTDEYNVDQNLTKKEKAESYAYHFMIEEKLYPALLYAWWLDNRNYYQTIKPWFSSLIKFPLNLIFPWVYKLDVEAKLRDLYPNLDVEGSELKNKLMRDAKQCLTTLSIRLGDKNYFFNDEPSSLDASVFGLLAPLIEAPLVANELKSYAVASPNLLNFVKKFNKKYFSEDIKDFHEKQKSIEEKNSKLYFHLSRDIRKKIYAVFTAFSALMLYGTYMGLLSFSLTNDVTQEVYFDEVEEDIDD